MSTIGLGTDIVAVGRIAELLGSHGERFLNRCFSAAEREYFAGRGSAALATTVAGRWAAKESFLKALGGRIKHIPYHEVSIEHLVTGGAELKASGRAAAALVERGGRLVHVSISHESEYAVATVIIED